MVKDIIVSAMFMLNLNAEAEQTKALMSGTNVIAERFLRFFNNVASEVGSDYRRGDETKTQYGFYDDPPEFCGITPRVLAYGVAAEYCITEGIDEAVTWDKRYKDGIAAAKRSPKSIKSRRFLGA